MEALKAYLDGLFVRLQLPTVSHFTKDPILHHLLDFFSVRIQEAKSCQIGSAILEIVQIDHMKILKKGRSILSA